MNQILEFLNGEMNRPLPYQSLEEGWFHYLALVLVVVGSVISVSRMKQMSDAKLKKTLLIFAGVLILFEIYKQLIFSYQANWSYQWYAFPFQFCSTPMYVALLAGLTKNKKVFEALKIFLATFGLFAGLAVMLYPMTVFVSTIGINIQTMVHHGGMAIIGLGILVNQIKLESKSIFKASLVFSVLVLIALVMNTIHNTWIQIGTFNMFFINPRFENGLPILGLFQPLVPAPIFLLIYIFGFSLCAYIMLFIGILTKHFNQRKEVSFQKA
ncbi:MAG: YwaF family protein [Acholeplasmataceae bacterium]|nr:YwaF family protein [Acholeplasmataceae bacterium]